MAKAALPWWELFILAFMAGMYVGVGGTFAVMIAGGISGAGTPGSPAIGPANRTYSRGNYSLSAFASTCICFRRRQLV
jgi:formate/nitrite transporter FocA (FNT family)